MMQNKDLGIKIAENTDEAFWTETKEQCEKAIKDHKRNIKISENVLELAKLQLKTIAEDS